MKLVWCCLTATCLLLLAIGTARGDPCSPPFVELSTGCYYFSEQAVTWWKAVANCRQHESELVTVDSRQVNGVLIDASRKLDWSFWLGASDLVNEGLWVWESNQRTFLYTAWGMNQPNNSNGNEHCLMLAKQLNFKWNDADCASKLNYICKKRSSSQHKSSEEERCHCNGQIACPPPFQSWPYACLFYSGSLEATWSEASMYCNATGGHLAEGLEDEELLQMQLMIRKERDAEHRAYDGETKVWLGASDLRRKGAWKWMKSGQPVNSSLRSSDLSTASDIDKNCLAFDVYNGVLKHDICSLNHPFVCQVTKKQ